MQIEAKILSDITVFMKYAKFNPTLNRRENWKELVDRKNQVADEKNTLRKKLAEMSGLESLDD